MATNLELYAMRNNQPLVERVAVSISKAIATVAGELVSVANHTARLTWARQALVNPHKEAEQVIWILLAQNAGLTTTQISAVTDAAIDTAVSNLVNALANVST